MTTCKRGHPRTPESTYLRPDGKYRACRVCHKEDVQKQRRIQKEADAWMLREALRTCLQNGSGRARY